MDAHEKHTAEQNLHALAVQRQAVQQQLVELDVALKELTHAQTAYKIVGGLMIGADVSTLRDELAKKKEASEARLSTLERQTEKLNAKLA